MNNLKNEIQNKLQIKKYNETFEKAFEDLSDIIEECETIEEIEKRINEIEFYSYYTSDCFAALADFSEILNIEQYNETFFGFPIFENIFIVCCAMYQDLISQIFDLLYSIYNNLYENTLLTFENDEIANNYKNIEIDEIEQYYQNDIIDFDEMNVLKFLDNENEFIMYYIKEEITE